MSLQMLPKKRTTNFREDETKLLIQLWGSPAVQNKLYLTHRKAPVMKLIAATMQKHGFYRTPDEIKTRIRNLKCLYHRIKKSVQTGQGIGIVDPDWPHYKAMDEILSKKNSAHRDLVYKENLLSEVSELTAMPVKTELGFDEDSNREDEMESNSSNDNGSDDEFDEASSPRPLIIEEDFLPKSGPIKIAPKPTQSVLKPAPTPVFPNLHIQTTPTLTSQQSQIQSQIQNQITNQIKVQMAQAQQQSNVVNSTSANGNNTQSMPFPLFILNPGSTNGQTGQTGVGTNKTMTVTTSGPSLNNNYEATKLLKELLQVQKENLEIEKQRLAVEKQKLGYDKLLGSQLLGLVPMFSQILDKLNSKQELRSYSNKSTRAKSPEPAREKTPEPHLKIPLLKTIKRSPSTEELFNVDTSEFQEGPILKNVLEIGKKRLRMDVEAASDCDRDSGLSDDCCIVDNHL